MLKLITQSEICGGPPLACVCMCVCVKIKMVECGISAFFAAVTIEMPLFKELGFEVSPEMNGSLSNGPFLRS